MLDIEIFHKRVDSLYTSQKGMVSAKKWKNGKRAGMVRKAAQPLYFTKRELELWLWKIVGLNAVPCPHCGAPIDILSLTLDHKTPRKAGGETSLENLEPLCRDCQQRKGPMTREAYSNILRFAKSELSPYDRDVLLSRLKAAHHGSMDRFGRDRDAQDAKQQPQRPAPPGTIPRLDFSDLGDF